MDFNHIFFENGIIDIIFEELTYHDQIRFSHVNQFTYITYHHRVKFLIHEFMNRDYKLFKCRLNTESFINMVQID